jgi:hypothetical protein
MTTNTGTVLIGTVLIGTVLIGTVLIGTVLIGTVLIGTVLFGSGSGESSSRVAPGLVHTAQWATAANLGFILLALVCALGLPRSLGSERAGENA